MRWIALLLACWPMAAAAQPAPADAFAAVLQNPGHRQEVLDAAQSTPSFRHASCRAPAFTALTEVGVYAQVRFAPSGDPIAGEWREGIEVTGCGAKLRLNVLTKVTAPATLATGPLMPGGTIADPVLQNLAQDYVVQAAGGVPATCKDAFIADTSFDGYQGKADTALPAGEISAPWREIWTIDLCGTAKRVLLNFSPNAQGVSVSAAQAP